MVIHRIRKYFELLLLMLVIIWWFM